MTFRDEPMVARRPREGGPPRRSNGQPTLDQSMVRDKLPLPSVNDPSHAAVPHSVAKDVMLVSTSTRMTALLDHGRREPEAPNGPSSHAGVMRHHEPASNMLAAALVVVNLSVGRTGENRAGWLPKESMLGRSQAKNRCGGVRQAIG